jgi:hypothetical protein
MEDIVKNEDMAVKKATGGIDLLREQGKNTGSTELSTKVLAIALIVFIALFIVALITRKP